MSSPPNTPENFWSKVVHGEGCWEWQGSRNRRGYGKVGWYGKRKATHRLAWELTYGPIPEGLWVLHHCDNPPCCNPEHLFLGNQRDNMQDAIKKGRFRSGIRQAERTHCPAGHPYDETNTYRHPSGRRACRECERQSTKRWRAANQEHLREYGRARRQRQRDVPR